MELNKNKKALVFITDTLIALLVLTIFIGVLPHMVKGDSEDLEVLIMKRNVDGALTMLDNEKSLHQILWMDENSGRTYIENELNLLIDSRYEYNAIIVIDDGGYSINHSEPGDTFTISKRLFVDSETQQDVTKYGYIELEVWQK